MNSLDQIKLRASDLQSSINRYIDCLRKHYPHLYHLFAFYSAYNQDNYLISSLVNRIDNLSCPLYGHFKDGQLAKYSQYIDRYKTFDYAEARISVMGSKLFSAKRLFSVYNQFIDLYRLPYTDQPCIVDIASGCGTLGLGFSILSNAISYTAFDVNPYFGYSSDLVTNLFVDKLKSIFFEKHDDYFVSGSKFKDSLSIPDISYQPSRVHKHVDSLSLESVTNFVSSSYSNETIDAIDGLKSLLPSSTDIVLLLSGLDYFDIESLAEQISRVIKPNGLFYLSTGSFYSPFGSGMSLPTPFPYMHLQHTKSDLLSLMSDCEYPFLDLLTSAYYFVSTHYSLNDIVMLFSRHGLRLVYHYFDADADARFILHQATSSTVFSQIAINDSGAFSKSVTTHDLDSRYFFLAFVKTA